MSTKPLTIFGQPVETSAVEQIENCLRDDHAVAGALMADHHKGYSMPIGGVIAYEDAISPSGVGFDIACGNKAVRTNLNVFDLGVDERLTPDFDTVKRLMREIQKSVAFGVGRSNPTPVDHDLFDHPIWPWLESRSPGLKKKAEQQLGTVGSGNHYVDLLVDESGYVWVAVHFGSRGLGHTIATGFMNLHDGLAFDAKRPETEDATVIPTTSDLGIYYVTAMNLAGEYAYAGRDYVVQQVLDILGAHAVESVHNHHNFAWLEDGKWVVRKGATPLTIEPAFIGGSMGDISVIVRGTPLADGYQEPGEVVDLGNLGSAPHGAGRVLSRTKAAGKWRKYWVCQQRDCGWRERALPGVTAIPECGICGKRKVRKLRLREGGQIDWDGVRRDLADRGIVVLGANAEEAPGVYKDLATVLACHPNIEIVHSLRPIGVVMAGDEFDPYKD